MGSCVIFCAGSFDGLAEPIARDDYILAADGGLTHVQTLGLEPHGIIGDFDSLGYIPQGATLFPVEKDDTDSMLAVRQGLKLGYDRFILYGSLDGPRLDHTLANFQTLQFLADHGAQGYLVGQRYLATVIKNSAISFPDTAQGIISVFCLGKDAKGVSISGLQYSLENGSLTAGFPLGVSNHFMKKPSRIQVNNGSLLILWDKENGFGKY